MSWLVEHRSGAADDLHHLEPDDARRRVLVMEPTGPAVALGSTQSTAVLDPEAVAASGRSVTRRHSGGGLVLLDPGGGVWVDVVIPVGDPRWSADVGEAFVWLGEVWASALSASGAVDAPADVHRGPALHADLGRVVCFAGVGSGEVTVHGRKVVGMSQRRTREFARFQCLVHREFVPGASVELLARQVRDGADGTRLRERLGTGVGVVGSTDDLLEAFLERLADH